MNKPVEDKVKQCLSNLVQEIHPMAALTDLMEMQIPYEVHEKLKTEKFLDRYENDRDCNDLVEQMREKLVESKILWHETILEALKKSKYWKKSKEASPNESRASSIAPDNSYSSTSSSSSEDTKQIQLGMASIKPEITYIPVELFSYDLFQIAKDTKMTDAGEIITKTLTITRPRNSVEQEAMSLKSINSKMPLTTDVDYFHKENKDREASQVRSFRRVSEAELHINTEPHELVVKNNRSSETSNNCPPNMNIKSFDLSDNSTKHKYANWSKIDSVSTNKNCNEKQSENRIEKHSRYSERKSMNVGDLGRHKTRVANSFDLEDYFPKEHEIPLTVKPKIDEEQMNRLKLRENRSMRSTSNGQKHDTNKAIEWADERKKRQNKEHSQQNKAPPQRMLPDTLDESFFQRKNERPAAVFSGRKRTPIDAPRHDFQHCESEQATSSKKIKKDSSDEKMFVDEKLRTLKEKIKTKALDTAPRKTISVDPPAQKKPYTRFKIPRNH